MLEQSTKAVSIKTVATRQATAARMRRCRARRRAGYRCYNVELHQSEIKTLIRRGYLQSDDRDDHDAVVTALYQYLEASMRRPSSLETGES